MTTSRNDMVYGRQGGRIVPWIEREPTVRRGDTARVRRSVYRAFGVPDRPIAVDQTVQVVELLPRHRVRITYPAIHPSTLIVPVDMLEDIRTP